MQKAIGQGCQGTFMEMAKAVYDVIYYDGRRLSEKEQQQLRSEYHYYLENIMFQHQVEYVFEDCYGYLYKNYDKIPKYKVFFRHGYRWKRTKIMLQNKNWFIFQEGGGIKSVPATALKPGMVEPSTKNISNKSRRRIQ